MRLPFADETFDLYVVRAAPHHFPRFDEFVREAFRVLRPGRDAAFIDCAPPQPARDVLHEVEKRRDPSHVLSLTLDEWTEQLQSAGFEVEIARARQLDWDYGDWMKTMAVTTDQGVRLQLRSLGTQDVEVTPELHGNEPWTRIEIPWTSGKDVQEVAACLVRSLSDQLENKIKGTTWVDDVALVPEAPEHPKP